MEITKLYRNSKSNFFKPDCKELYQKHARFNLKV
jgi:hypothetical protein